ncbi:Serine/threonine-protein kinase pkn3 [Labilithrix luteola]|uniref:Serine/threonine-protein kinase pkn3 n=1 Tax=Labilithrix luteola TaxID=1391654 RepID=A0A0K1QB35_9BACT|nr:serine/threonine-protein kinase [Labilithrix luteola]AKV02877.1 Serine/threonine-protein kinase pkn3 [Labilithrix luteola]
MSASVEREDPRAEDRVGSVLNDKWTLERLLGKGGMAAVYAGRHRNGARAAVKVLHPDIASVDEVRERFLREGYAANRVEHRGAVQVLDDDVVKEGPDAGTAYIVMEMLEGESLEERGKRGARLTEHELLVIMEAVLEVLEAAHAHGVVHRDLKPENLFLARDPEREGIRVKVLDFGLARLSETGPVTSAGLALGTPAYMSPEQASGKTSEIDGRTDLFALGATAFRLITGRRIHDADNIVMQVVKMATVPAPRIRTVKADVSEPFARIVDRAIAFNREDRYPDATAMLADVRAARDLLAGDGPTMLVMPYSIRQPATSRVSRSSNPPALEPASAQPASMDATMEVSSRELALEPPRSRVGSEPRPQARPDDESSVGATADIRHESNRAPARRKSERSSRWPWAVGLLAVGGLAWLNASEIRARLTESGVLGALDLDASGAVAPGAEPEPSDSGVATSELDAELAMPVDPAVRLDTKDAEADLADAEATDGGDAGDTGDAGDDDDDDIETDAGPSSAPLAVEPKPRASAGPHAGTKRPPPKSPKKVVPGDHRKRKRPR